MAAGGERPSTGKSPRESVTTQEVDHPVGQTPTGQAPDKNKGSSVPGQPAGTPRPSGARRAPVWRGGLPPESRPQRGSPRGRPAGDGLDTNESSRRESPVPGGAKIAPQTGRDVDKPPRPTRPARSARAVTGSRTEEPSDGRVVARRPERRSPAMPSRGSNLPRRSSAVLEVPRPSEEKDPITLNASFFRSPDESASSSEGDGRLNPTADVAAVVVREVAHHPKITPGSDDAMEISINSLKASLTEAHAAGESVTFIQGVRPDGRVDSVVAGGIHTVGDVDPDNIRELELVPGASGPSVDLKTIEEGLNANFPNAATIVVDYNPLMQDARGTQDLTHVLYNLADGVNGVTAYRFTPVDARDLGKLSGKLRFLGMEQTRLAEIDKTAETMVEAVTEASKELGQGASLGMWQMVVSVAVPDANTRKQTLRNLERLAGKVAKANASDRPYNLSVVRDKAGKIVVSNSIKDALALIPGNLSLVTTPFIAEAVDPFPRTPTRGVSYVEANAFPPDTKDAERPGTRIRMGKIFRWNNRTGESANPLDLRLDNLPLGLLIVGQPGKGKSEVISLVVEGAAAEGKQFMILGTQKGKDFYKIGARLIERWEREHPPEFINLSPSDAQAIWEGNVNLFNPEGNVAIKEWAEMIVQRSTQGYTGNEEGRDMFTDIMRAAILNAYQQQGFDVNLSPREFLKRNKQKVEDIVSLWPDWHMVLENAVNATRDNNLLPSDATASDLHDYFSKIKKEWEELPRPEVFVIDPSNPDAQVVNINVFKPGENTTIRERIGQVIEIFAGGYEGDEEGRRLLMTYLRAALLGYGPDQEPDPAKQMKGVYEELGFDVNLNMSVYQGGENRWPDWHMVLLKALEAVTKIGNQGYSAEITANVEKYIRTNFANFTGGFLSDLMNNQEFDIEPSDLLKMKSIWNFEALSEQEKGFAAQLLARLIDEAKKSPNETHELTDLQKALFLIVLDEAWDALERPEQGRRSPKAKRFAQIIATGRWKKLSIVAATQMAANVIEEILKIPGMKIVLGTRPQDEREVIGEAMGATPEMIEQMGSFSEGVAAVSYPNDVHPVKAEFRNPEGKTNDPTQVNGVGKEGRATNKQLAEVKAELIKNKPELSFLRGWAAIITLVEATNRKKENENQRISELYAIPPEFMNIIRDIQPKHAEVLLRKIATEAIDDRAEWVLGLISRGKEFLDEEGKVPNPNYIANTRKGLIERVYRIMHNKIYEKDAGIFETLHTLDSIIQSDPQRAQEQLPNLALLIAEKKVPANVQEDFTIQEVLDSIIAFEPVELLPDVLGDFTMRPYIYAQTIMDIAASIAEDPAKALQPYEGMSRLVEEGLLYPEHVTKDMSALDLSRVLENLQKEAIESTFELLGPGRLYLGNSSAGSQGGGLEWGMGSFWNYKDSPRKIAEFIDIVITDSYIANSLKAELVPFLRERIVERRLSDLIEARYTLESYNVQNPLSRKLAYPDREKFAKKGLVLEGKTSIELLRSVESQIAEMETDTPQAPSEESSLEWISAESANHRLVHLQVFRDSKSYQNILSRIRDAERMPEIYSNLSENEKKMLGYGGLVIEEASLEKRIYGEYIEERETILRRLDEIRGKDLAEEKNRLTERLVEIRGKDLATDEKEIIEGRLAEIRGQNLSESAIAKIVKKRRADEIKLLNRWLTTSSKFDFGEDQAQGSSRERLVALLTGVEPGSVRFRALRERLQMERALIQNQMMLKEGEIPSNETMQEARDPLQQFLTTMTDIYNPRLAITYLQTFLSEGNHLISDYTVGGKAPEDAEQDEMNRRLAAIQALETDIDWLENREAVNKSEDASTPETPERTVINEPKDVWGPAIVATMPEGLRDALDRARTETDHSTSWISIENAGEMYDRSQPTVSEIMDKFQERQVLINAEDLSESDKFRLEMGLAIEMLDELREFSGLPTVGDKLYKSSNERLKDYLRTATAGSARFKGMSDRLALEEAFIQARELIHKGINSQGDAFKAENIGTKAFNIFDQSLHALHDTIGNIQATITYMQAYYVETSTILDDYEASISDAVIPPSKDEEEFAINKRIRAIEWMRDEMVTMARENLDKKQ